MAGNSNSGRKAISDEEKALKGTLRKSRIKKNDFRADAITQMPEPPSKFFEDIDIVNIWYKVGNELIDKGVLTFLDLPKFTRYCQLIYVYNLHEEQLYDVTTSPQDFYKILSINKSLNELESKFGLDPASRTKIIIPTKAKVSPLLQKIRDAKSSMKAPTMKKVS